MARLPQPGGDSGNWGTILNDYLSQSHKSDGSLKDNTVQTTNVNDIAITKPKLSSSVQSSLDKADSSIQTSSLGAPSGVATLTGSTLTPSQLPSNVATTDKIPTIVDITKSPYFAAKNGTGDQTAVFNQAYVDLTAAGGGVIYVPSGNYRFTGTIQARTRVVLRGDGMGSTKLFWPSDLGTGTYAIDTSGQGIQNTAPSISSVAIEGPSAESTKGVRTVNMSGIKLGRNVDLDHCFISRFGVGVDILGDHNKINYCKVSNCYFNLLWGESPVTLGDQSVSFCDLSGAAMASIAVCGSNIIDSSYIHDTHLGFAPYGIYRFDGISPSSRGFITATDFVQVSMEQIGNGGIYEASTGPQLGLSNSRFVDMGYSWDTGGWGGGAIVGTPKDYAISVRVCQSVTFSGSALPTAGDIAAFHLPSAAEVTLEARNAMVIANLFSPTTNGSGSIKVDCATRQGVVLVASGTITAKDILEKNGSGFQVARFSGANPYVGIAAHSAASGDRIVVWNEGIVSVTSETVTAGGRLVAPNGGGILYRAGEVPNYGGATAGDATQYPMIGVSQTNGGASGGGDLIIQLIPSGQSDHNFLRPLNYATLPAPSSNYRGLLARVAGGAGVADTIYVCRKKSDGSYEWQSLGGGGGSITTTPVIQVTSGLWYSPPGTRTTGTRALNQMTMIPLYLPACTITEMGIEVTTLAASSSIRLGLYSLSGGIPTTLIVDAGTVDSTTTGIKSVTLSTPVNISEGWYVTAVALQGGTPSCRVIGAPNVVLGAPNVNASGLTGAGWSSLGISGNLPAVAPTPQPVDTALVATLRIQ